jgi:predicted ester cyclase
MSVEENKAIARRFNDELWNKGNLDIIDELMAEDLVAHPGMRSRDDFKQSMKQGDALWPERTMTFEQVFGEGDMVVIRWTIVLTHTHEVMGVAPTGKKIKWVGISMYRIANGKIVEDWAQSDILGFHKQLGSTPNMEEVRESTWD